MPRTRRFRNHERGRDYRVPSPDSKEASMKQRSPSPHPGLPPRTGSHARLRSGARALPASAVLLLLLAACSRPATDTAQAQAQAPAAPATPAPAEAQAAPAVDASIDASADASGLEPGLPAVVEARWQCGQQQVAGRFDNRARTLTLTHEHGQLLLPQAISASGARYADSNGNQMWVKGQAATLTRSGKQPQECQELAPTPQQP
mgnify:CR=1 FL=1